jgi:hypothetical protein
MGVRFSLAHMIFGSSLSVLPYCKFRDRNQLSRGTTKCSEEPDKEGGKENPKEGEDREGGLTRLVPEVTAGAPNAITLNLMCPVNHARAKNVRSVEP